jgi:hypothetical protein
LIKLVPTIKDERPTPTEDIKKLVGLLGQDKSKEKILELIDQIKEFTTIDKKSNLERLIK